MICKCQGLPKYSSKGQLNSSCITYTVPESIKRSLDFLWIPEFCHHSDLDQINWFVLQFPFCKLRAAAKATSKVLRDVMVVSNGTIIARVKCCTQLNSWAVELCFDYTKTNPSILMDLIYLQTPSTMGAVSRLMSKYGFPSGALLHEILRHLL